MTWNIAPIRSAQADSAGAGRLTRATHEFEALLLETLLKPLEQSMGAVPGDAENGAAGSYASLATEVLASSLAAGRGFGIAALLQADLHKGIKPMVTVVRRGSD